MKGREKFSIQKVCMIQLHFYHIYYVASSAGSVVKNLPAKRHWFEPLVGKIPWGRKWQPTPVFLPGESHGQRSLEGYSP